MERANHGQKGFFDVERRLEAISAKGDPLETIKKMVRWEDFRTDIEVVTETQPEERKSNAGRKPYDTILKFKIVVLQSLHNLSDEQTEYLIRDRISFMRFLDLELEDPVPDATTIWLFRQVLAQAGLIDKVFERFGQHLEAAGYIARGGQIIYATIVSVPQAAQHEGDRGRQDAGGMEAAARQACPEGQGRALDEEERRELLRLQEPCRRGQADP
jgi:transposase